MPGCYALSKFVKKSMVYIHWVVAPDPEGKYYLQDCDMDREGVYSSLEELIMRTPAIVGAFPVGHTKVSAIMRLQQY
jgi:hypothetical protein